MSIETLRKQIDSIDNQILELIAKRMNIAKEIAEIKKQSNLPLEDKKREEELLQARTRKMKELGIDDRKLVEGLFTLLMNKSKETQKEAMK